MDIRQTKQWYQVKLICQDPAFEIVTINMTNMAQWLWYWGLKMLFCCDKSTPGIPTLTLWPSINSRVGWVWKREGHLGLEFYFDCGLIIRAASPASALDFFLSISGPRGLFMCCWWILEVEAHAIVLWLETRRHSHKLNLAPVALSTVTVTVPITPWGQLRLTGTRCHPPGGCWICMLEVFWRGHASRGHEHTCLCASHLLRQPHRRFCTDLHQSTALEAKQNILNWSGRDETFKSYNLWGNCSTDNIWRG